MARRTHRLKRVSVRTLILMVELLGFFIAYQCLVFIRVAPTPARTQAVQADVKPDRPVDASVPDAWTSSTGNQTVSIATCTPALRRAIEAGEGSRGWYNKTEADPNDRVEPDDSGPASEDVE